jgi:mycothiol synthase
MNISTNRPIYRHLDFEVDLIPLVTFLNEIKQADHEEGVSEAELREQLTWSGQDPTEDNWVVDELDRARYGSVSSLIGWGQIQKTSIDEIADLGIYVHPSSRREGIGSQLLAILLSRAHELNARAVRSYVDVQNQGAMLFTRRHGFEPVSTYTHMKVSAAYTFPRPELPSGFVIRSYDQIQSIDLYTQIMNRSYQGLWGHLQTSQEEHAQLLPQLKQEGIFLLFAPDGAVAGSCRGFMSEPLTARRGVPMAYVDAPGVVPEYRSAGLYLPLLLTVLHWLLPQGPAAIELESWGDAPETLALYRQLGFTVIKEEISYRRELV